MNTKKKKRLKNWTILNLVFYFLTLGINFLGATGYFNGMAQKDISDKYTTAITPAGFAFSIWSVIYGLLLITLIYLFIKRNDNRVSRLVEIVSPLFIISSLGNMGWIILFSYEKIGLSVISIIVMLITLMSIIERLYRNRSKVPYVLTGVSFTLYASWVFIATILNISLFLVQKNWQGFGISTSVWTIIILFVVIGLVLFYLSISKNAVFPVSLAWGFFGIYSSYKNGAIISPMGSIIKGVLLFGIGIFIISIIGIFIKNGNSIFPKGRSYRRDLY